MSNANALDAHNKGGGEVRRRMRRAVASAAVASIALTGAVALTAAPAYAAGNAEAGVGFGTLHGQGEFPGGGGWMGSIYVPGVGYTFCVNPSMDTGYTGDGTIQSSYNRTYTSDSGWDEVSGKTYTADLTPREMFEASYLMTTYGQLDAPRTGYTREQAEWAAAVELAIWDRAVPLMETNSWGARPPSALYASRAGSSEAGVLAKINAMNADVANQMPSSSTTASGSLNVEMTNYRDGELVVNLAGTPSASVVLTLTGATFSATGSNTMTVEATNGLRIPITGDYSESIDGEEPTYNISASGQGTIQGTGLAENARVHSSGGQETISPGVGGPTTFELAGTAVDPIIIFDAVVSTEAPKFIGEGETFTDTLYATVANPTDPAANPWPQAVDGSYVPVEARGTLYGPFLALPDESADAPSWAPVVATDIPVTLRGPGEYTADSGVGSLEPGYYTWVWEIDAADQPPFIANWMPTDYHFKDSFAQTIESTISPSKVVAVSEVVESEVAITGKVSDTLTVGSQGGWIQADGKRVPVTFDGTAYFVEGDTAPEISDTVPEGAEVIGTSQIVADGPGTYTSTELDAPARQGWVVWVWEINAASQPEQYRGYVMDWADQYGIPSEMTRVLAPIVATQAQTDVPVGDPIWDTAVVTGKVPESGLNLHFELYEATKNDAGEWVCEAGGNLLWTSSAQTITEEGTYTSPNAPMQPEGTYHWVEVVTTPGGEEVSRGECGIPNETSEVIVPEVTTNAQPGAKLGGELFDVATVTGPIAESGYDLTFQAYKVPTVKDETTGEWVTDYPEGYVPSEEEGATNLEWVCEADPVFETSEAIRVTEEGDFTSESFVPEEFGKYLWVETLTWNGDDGESIEIHRGECGIAEESGVILDVTTKAQTDNGDQTVDLGEMAWDKAILNGYVPEGATVTIVGYQTSESTPIAEACVAENVVFEWTSEPLAGGMAENLEVDSDKFTPEKMGTDQTLYFIETTKDALGRTVSEGECGEPDETLVVTGEGEIAWTGGDSAPALWVGGAALLGLFGAASIYMARRRQTA